MQLTDYVKKDTIFLNCQAQSRAELFSKVSDKLLNEGYVKKGFLDFINHREDNYPTGLQLQNHTVAIPHGDPQFINKPFVAVITLTKPVTMRRMDDATIKLPVDTLFTLGLTNGSDHLDLLKEIMKLLQTDSFVQQIKNCTNKDEVETVIRVAEKKRKENSDD